MTLIALRLTSYALAAFAVYACGTYALALVGA